MNLFFILTLLFSVYYLPVLGKEPKEVCTTEYNPVCGSDGVTYPNECQMKLISHQKEIPITVKYNGECEVVCQIECTGEHDPVCGSNGITYSNECQLRLAACQQKITINVQHEGSCQEPVCDEDCPDDLQLVCGSDGNTYTNICHLKRASCRSKFPITLRHEGECTQHCDFACSEHYLPVCGTDGITYPNDCHLQLASCETNSPIHVLYEGECQPNCKFNCDTNPAPVCGSNGITYLNVCHLKEAACVTKHPIVVHSEGKCQPVCNIVCAKEYKPVCGSDGETYSNKCLLELASCQKGTTIDILSPGPCPEIHVGVVVEPPNSVKTPPNQKVKEEEGNCNPLETCNATEEDLLPNPFSLLFDMEEPKLDFLTDFLEIPTEFQPLVTSLGVVALFLVVSLGWVLFYAPNTISKIDQYICGWLIYDALTHAIMEGAFVYHSIYGTVNTSDGFLSELWKEYTKADIRWGVSDPTVVSLEILTVFLDTFLCIVLFYAILCHKHYRHFVQIFLCVCELYGGWMTFCPEWLSGSVNLAGIDQPLLHFLYLWFFNGLWVVVPLLLLYNSWTGLENLYAMSHIRVGYTKAIPMKKRID